MTGGAPRRCLLIRGEKLSSEAVEAVEEMRGQFLTFLDLGNEAREQKRHFFFGIL